MTLSEIKFGFSPHVNQPVLCLGKLCSLGLVTPGRNPIRSVCIVRCGEQDNMDRQLRKTKTKTG